MRLLAPLVGVAAALAMPTADTTAQDKKAVPLYEMRTYYAPPGKLDALHARFRDHTVKLFARHGMTNVGYFVPEGENKANKLVYFLSHKDRAARDASFKAFGADPEWKAAYAASEKDGKILDKLEYVFLTPTDYSPVPTIEAKGGRVFELRTYTTTKGNLPGLDARFRDHTMKLFEKHGMTNVVYWHRATGQADAERNLTYLLAHPSKAAGLKAFDAFRMDPDWLAARKASEDKAGGSLTEATNGVLSEYLVPTDYSPLK